ncbi:hypothetical protein CCO03_00915 [Comamonas serinivorans]|uniref:Uncharacterized protein n=1 Tax=Comamonas serinivorans TaxID=1082851 RepID=A0A1Y0EJH5_9BURK|nr:hypothetical protein CCO03_00915 [Comamonas serinivorans]
MLLQGAHRVRQGSGAEAGITGAPAAQAALRAATWWSALRMTSGRPTQVRPASITRPAHRQSGWDRAR